MQNPATQTERLIHDIELALCVPVTQLRMHMDMLAKRLILHLRQQETTIETLRLPH